MKKVLLTNILYVITFIPLYAQTASLEITGTIIDASTNQPLPNASVGLFEKINKKLTQIELSDLEGKFTFSNLSSTTYTIRIQYVGYKEKTIDSLSLSQSLNLNTILLTPIQHNLSEVSVRAVKPIVEQKANSITINVSESALATGGTAYDILQKTPGVTASDGGLNLRGKQLSLLLDGRLVNLPAEEVVNMLQTMPASSIEKLELIGNPSSKYDGQVQAILNIKTLKPKHDSWGGNITLAGGYGRALRSNSSINLFYKKNKFSTVLGWDYINTTKQHFRRITMGYSQAPLNYLFNQYVDNRMPSSTHNVKIDINYNLHPYHTVGFSIRPMMNPQGFFSTTETAIQQDNRNQIDSMSQSISQSDMLYKSINGNIYYKTTFDSAKNKELTINGDYYSYSRSSTTSYNIKTFENNGIEKRPSESQNNDNPINIDIRSATMDYTHITPLGRWEAGLKTAWTTITTTSIWKKYNGGNWIIDKSLSNDFLYSEAINAAYIGLSGESKKINYQVSFRAEHTSIRGTSPSLDEPVIKNYVNLLPNFNIEYNPSKNHQWALYYQQTIERPIYNYVNPFVQMVNPNRYNQGNPSIMPQINYIGDLTYGYKQHIFIKLTYLQITPFIGSIFRQFDSTEASIRKMENYTTASDYIFNVSINQSIYSWWQINAYAEISYFKARHPEVTYSKITPIAALNISSTISLPAYWSLELAAYGQTPQYDGFYYHGQSYTISGGIKKSFLQKRLTASLLIAIRLPRWYESVNLYNIYSSLINYDERFAMLSISYKLGNAKNDIRNRKSAIDAEKNRTKE